VTTVDQDNQDVIVDQPGRGEFFGLASMLDQTPHPTREQITRALDGNLCRCGSQPRILRAIERAAK